MIDLSRASARRVSAWTLCIAVGVFTACNKSEPPPRKSSATPQVGGPAIHAPDVAFRVTRVDLGKAVDRDKKIIAPTVTFQRYDVIYASVLTEGSARDIALKARWTFGSGDGELIHESTQMVSPTGPLATEFHVGKQDGWAAGPYKLAVTASGQPAMAVEYTITE